MEKINRQVLRKSLVAATDLPAGTCLTRQMIETKGPGKGLSPQRIEELVGTILRRPVAREDYFTENDLQPKPNGAIPRDQLRRPWGLKARFYDLADILAKKPQLVELHFSQVDVDLPFSPPAAPYTQQLFVHAPEFADSQLLDLCSPDDALWEKSIDLLQRTIDKAALMAPHFAGPVGVVIHVGGMSLDQRVADATWQMARAVTAFRRLDAHGIQLLPENLPPRPWYLGGQWLQDLFSRPEEMIDFCQELDLGMTLDVSHAQLYCNLSGRDLLSYVRQCLPYVRHLHLADAAGIDGEGLQIGEGHVDWDALLPLLADSSFTWVPEIWSGHLDDAAGFVTALQRLAQFEVL